MKDDDTSGVVSLGGDSVHEEVLEDDLDNVGREELDTEVARDGQGEFAADHERDWMLELEDASDATEAEEDLRGVLVCRFFEDAALSLPDLMAPFLCL